jgi:CheY-like chemotaxis protein
MPAESWVLLIDDDIDVCEILADLLAREQLDARCAADGAEAINLLQDILERSGSLPSLIVTDLLMPGIVGTSVIDFVRAEPRLANIPVVVVSSAPHLAPAGYVFFRKPVKPEELVQYILDHAVAQMTSDAHARAVVRRS